jgi:integrase
MKSGEEMRVPLCDAAIALLAALRPLRCPERGDFVFPGQKPGRPISNMTMSSVLDRLQVAVDVHGFRSTFRDWVGEATGHPSDVAEVALDHLLPGGKTRAAYQRGDLLRKRAVMMADWGDYFSASSAPSSIGPVA